ncbi:GDYXXLXY domain-containing protein [Bacillus sp. JJ664]
MKNKKKLILLSLVQYILLLSLLGSILYFKQTADTFKIEAESLDPIEPLLGHYAALSYKFDEITDKEWKGKAKPKEGQKIYIVFKKSEKGFYVFDFVTDQRPEKSKYISAKISYLYDSYDNGEKVININHNLDRFYIPEHQMDEYNQPGQDYIVTVKHKKDRAIVQTVDVSN